MYQPANAVRLHVSLAEIDPPIWRRLVVPSDWTLDRLHLVLQAAFSWTDSICMSSGSAGCDMATPISWRMVSGARRPSTTPGSGWRISPARI